MPWPQDAYVGQEVVCVDDAINWRVGYNEIVPKAGMIYTIREILILEGILALRLKEIVNKPCDYYSGYGECAFAIIRFRPLQSTETGMSILRGLLVPNKELVDA